MRQPFLAGLMLSVFLGATALPARADVINTLFGATTPTIAAAPETVPPAGAQPDPDIDTPTAIPEPSMVILGGLGGLLLVGYRRLRAFYSRA